MKKIPTLFKRIYHDASHLTTTDQLTPGLEWVLEGRGVATVKYDGTCCAIKSGRFYRRYDAKKGKVPPAGAIPCCAPDPVTGHWPHWLECDFTNTTDNWHRAPVCAANPPRAYRQIYVNAVAAPRPSSPSPDIPAPRGRPLSSVSRTVTRVILHDYVWGHGDELAVDIPSWIGQDNWVGRTVPSREVGLCDNLVVRHSD